MDPSVQTGTLFQIDTPLTRIVKTTHFEDFLKNIVPLEHLINIRE